MVIINPDNDGVEVQLLIMRRWCYSAGVCRNIDAAIRLYLCRIPISPLIKGFSVVVLVVVMVDSRQCFK